MLLFAVAITMFTSVWGELTRDMRYALTSVLPIWFLLTPVLYPLSSAPPQLQSWMHLNPMTSLVETFRWSVFGIGRFDPWSFAASAAGALVLGVRPDVFRARRCHRRRGALNRS